MERAAISSIIAETCAAYDGAAEEYALSTRDFGAYPGLRETLLSFVEVVPAGTAVLDLGAGGGRDAELIVSCGRPVVAGDISANMLGQLKKRVVCPPGTPLALVQMNMTRLPFCDMTFGGVWACGSVLHVPVSAMGPVLDEIMRVLLPGGMTSISMRDGVDEGWRDGGSLPGRRWFSHIRPDDFRAMMDRAGFRDLDIRYRGRPGWYVVTGRKAT